LDYELEVTALELPSIAIVDQGGSPAALDGVLARRLVGTSGSISFWFWFSAIHRASSMSSAAG